MKKGILVTSFGTSHSDTRKKTIEVIENLVIEKYGKECFERAFTSNIIRKIIQKNENLKIYNQKEGLEALKQRGFSEVITMSLHILAGIEYSKLDDTYGKITEPLLATDSDYEEIVQNNEFNDLENNDAIVFMGHGSDHKEDVIYKTLQEKYNSSGKNNIFVATVEGKITLKDVVEKLSKTNFKNILLKPLMIVAGDHAKNDMASDEEDSWKSILKKNGYNVTVSLKGMGEYDFIQKMFMKKLEKVL